MLPQDLVVFSPSETWFHSNLLGLLALPVWCAHILIHVSCTLRMSYWESISINDNSIGPVIDSINIAFESFGFDTNIPSHNKIFLGSSLFEFELLFKPTMLFGCNPNIVSNSLQRHFLLDDWLDLFSPHYCEQKAATLPGPL